MNVVQNEPIKYDNRLFKLDNVFISPHIANALYNALDTQVQTFIEKLKEYNK